MSSHCHPRTVRTECNRPGFSVNTDDAAESVKLARPRAQIGTDHMPQLNGLFRSAAEAVGKP